MDEYIKNAFDMLVDRIHNLEDYAKQHEKAFKLAECMKFGILNNHFLGHPFEIQRLKGGQYDTTPSPRLSAVIVGDLQFFKCSCTISYYEVPYRGIGRDDLADKQMQIFNENESGVDDHLITSGEAGWNRSSYVSAIDEAYDRYLKQKFENSGLIPRYLDDYSVAIATENYHLRERCAEYPYLHILYSSH